MRHFLVGRRALLAPLFALALAALAASAPAQAPQPQRPIVFVHGNGDSAALWITTLWRFESNGYNPNLLFPIDFPNPLARSDDTKYQPNRSSTADQAADLSAMVTGVLTATHQDKVILIGNSRGVNTIRNTIKNFGGRDKVAMAILSGGTNHGLYALPTNLNWEFNGASPFMTQLNAGSEVVPGVDFVTIRSDKLDKYAQPTGEFVGMPGKPTHVSFDAPELKGALNIVLGGVDHRETAFHKRAFREMYKAILGREPASVEIKPEAHPVLNGMVSGFEAGGPTNLPLAGARVSVFEVNPATGEREGGPVHQATIGADGMWGPFTAKPTAYYEWVIAAPGYPTTHEYRTPFPRSSRYVHYRLAPLDKKLEGAGSAVTLTRPRGYLGHGRDTFTLDGAVPEGVNPGVPGTSAATKTFPAGPSRAVSVVLNEEHMTVRTWPLAEGHVVFAEFHY